MLGEVDVIQILLQKLLDLVWEHIMNWRALPANRGVKQSLGTAVPHADSKSLQFLLGHLDHSACRSEWHHF